MHFQSTDNTTLYHNIAQNINPKTLKINVNIIQIPKQTQPSYSQQLNQVPSAFSKSRQYYTVSQSFSKNYTEND